MCFHVSDKKRVADRDIACWKVLSGSKGCYQSIYGYYRWDLSADREFVARDEYMRRELDTLRTEDSGRVINEGMHSYTNWWKALMAGVWIKGFAVKRFYIPKGTEYYKNHHNEYVSVKLGYRTKIFFVI